MNVGFTVKNTTQEPIDFLATSKPYVGSYPLFTGKSQLKNGLEVKSSLIFVRKNVFDVCIGMSIPLIVSCYLHQWEPIELVMSNGETMDGVVGLRIFLFILTGVCNMAPDPNPFQVILTKVNNLVSKYEMY